MGKVRINEHGIREDAEIASDLTRGLKADFEVLDNQIHIRVTDGVVTIEGTVDRSAQKLAAERCARKVEGILGIENRIEVAVPEIPPEDW